MDAFAKSDDERDFYLDRVEGFLLYLDLDKPNAEVSALEAELAEHAERYTLIPKMTFYETKKVMEGFVNEKVYDIDTKDKLLDIIGAPEARENFLEFLHDHLPELEKWQLYYSERSRVRIIEWLRNQQIRFVFEEDLDIPRFVIEKVKRLLFETKVPKEVQQAREVLSLKGDTYYSNEALNPRPKRGRPPKQVVKVDTEPQFAIDVYTTVPPAGLPFLYLVGATSASVSFSAKFNTEKQASGSQGTGRGGKVDARLAALSQRLASLQNLSERLVTLRESGGTTQDERLIKTLQKARIGTEENKESDIEENGEEHKSKRKASSSVGTRRKK
jgi:hypothetical protein